MLVQGSLGLLLDQLILLVGGKLGPELPLINARAAEVPNSSILTLANSLLVQRIALDRPIGGSLERSSAAIGASSVRQETGLDGRGVGVAVIDSGISGNLPDFKGANGSSRITANVIVSNATRSGDDYGHGTHVAGILACNSFNRYVSDPSYGDYVGIAPEANVVALKVADDDGDATMVDVITALQYVVHHKDQLGIGVVNVSMSSDTPGSYLDDPIDAAVEYVWHSGVVVVVAAGNRGDSAQAVD